MAVKFFKKKETEAEEVARICRETLYPKIIPPKVPMNRTLARSLKLTAITSTLVFVAIYHVQIVHYMILTWEAIVLFFTVLFFIIKWIWLVVAIDISRALWHRLTIPKHRRR